MTRMPFKTLRVKHLAVKIGSGKTPLGGASVYLSAGVMFLRSQNVHFDGLRLDDVVYIGEETDEEMTATRVREGDVLLNITGASLGRCAYVPPGTPPGNVNQHVCIIRGDPRKVSYRYLNAVIQAPPVQQQIFSGENGSSREGLTFEQVGNLIIQLPPLREQNTIADYLERETARLDRLIATKEQLLGLLAEKRQALITRAITRGLDTDVPVRDSCIPWLGPIPEHWNTERTKWLFRERDERSQTGEEELLTVSHLTGVTTRAEKDVSMFEAETTEGYKLCHQGDLVINTLWAWMGAMGVAPMTGIVSPAYNVYTPGPELDPGYIDAMVRLPIFAQEVTRYSKGVWSSRLRLYPEGFFETELPVPPPTEQREIVSFIETEVAKLKKFGAATERTIALLKERRSALIAAAVTGQITVSEE